MHGFYEVGDSLRIPNLFHPIEMLMDGYDDRIE